MNLSGLKKVDLLGREYMESSSSTQHKDILTTKPYHKLSAWSSTAKTTIKMTIH
jgi:hypothetical protein